MEFTPHMTDDISLEDLLLITTEEGDIEAISKSEAAPSRKSGFGLIVGGVVVSGGFVVGMAAAAMVVGAVGTGAYLFL